MPQTPYYSSNLILNVFKIVNSMPIYMSLSSESIPSNSPHFVKIQFYRSKIAISAEDHVKSLLLKKVFKNKKQKSLQSKVLLRCSSEFCPGQML